MTSHAHVHNATIDTFAASQTYMLTLIESCPASHDRLQVAASTLTVFCKALPASCRAHRCQGMLLQALHRYVASLCYGAVVRINVTDV